MKVLSKIVIPGERPQSWNGLYSGKVHWSARSAEKDRVRQVVRAAVDMDQAAVQARPVEISLVAFFQKRPLDADNIAAKLYIDALKGIFIEDDSPKYVSAVTTASRIDRKNPRVEIEIRSPDPLS